MNRHYHVFSGMPGYLPVTSDVTTSRRHAVAIAAELVRGNRQAGETWHSSLSAGGYASRGDGGCYVEIQPCTDDCEPSDY